MIDGHSKPYRYPDEPGAVMLALRVTRDQDTSATVYDPHGNVICSFSPRKYDTHQYAMWRASYMRQNTDLQETVARARSERLGKEAAPNRKVLKKR